MDNESIAQKLVRNLSFEIKTATPKNESKSTPLNVKVRVKRKNKFLKYGVIAVPKAYTNHDIIRIANSDQTVMSFDLFVEPNLQKNPTKKQRKKLMEIIGQGTCLGTRQNDEDLCYLPSSSYNQDLEDKSVKSKSEGLLHPTTTLSKKNYLDSSSVIPNQFFFGKCKPGGCLDPPFNEDKYSYIPTIDKLLIPSQESKSTIKNVVKNGSTTINIETKKTNTLAIENLLRSDQKDTTCMLKLYEAGSVNTSLNTTHSNSIITYPPTCSYSDCRMVSEKNVHNNVSPDLNINLVNQHCDSYFTPSIKARKQAEKIKSETNNSVDRDKDSTRITSNDSLYTNSQQYKVNNSIVVDQPSYVDNIPKEGNLNKKTQSLRQDRKHVKDKARENFKGQLKVNDDKGSMSFTNIEKVTPILVESLNITNKQNKDFGEITEIICHNNPISDILDNNSTNSENVMEITEGCYKQNLQGGTDYLESNEKKYLNKNGQHLVNNQEDKNNIALITEKEEMLLVSDLIIKRSKVTEVSSDKPMLESIKNKISIDTIFAVESRSSVVSKKTIHSIYEGYISTLSKTDLRNRDSVMEHSCSNNINVLKPELTRKAQVVLQMSKLSLDKEKDSLCSLRDENKIDIMRLSNEDNITGKLSIISSAIQEIYIPRNISSAKKHSSLDSVNVSEPYLTSEAQVVKQIVKLSLNTERESEFSLHDDTKMSRIELTSKDNITGKLSMISYSIRKTSNPEYLDSMKRNSNSKNIIILKQDFTRKVQVVKQISKLSLDKDRESSCSLDDDNKISLMKENNEDTHNGELSFISSPIHKTSIPVNSKFPEKETSSNKSNIMEQNFICDTQVVNQISKLPSNKPIDGSCSLQGDNKMSLIKGTSEESINVKLSMVSSPIQKSSIPGNVNSVATLPSLINIKVSESDLTCEPQVVAQISKLSFNIERENSYSLPNDNIVGLIKVTNNDNITDKLSIISSPIKKTSIPENSNSTKNYPRSKINNMSKTDITLEYQEVIQFSKLPSIISFPIGKSSNTELFNEKSQTSSDNELDKYKLEKNKKPNNANDRVVFNKQDFTEGPVLAVSHNEKVKTVIISQSPNLVTSKTNSLLSTLSDSETRLIIPNTISNSISELVSHAENLPTSTLQSDNSNDNAFQLKSTHYTAANPFNVNNQLNHEPVITHTYKLNKDQNHTLPVDSLKDKPSKRDNNDSTLYEAFKLRSRDTANTFELGSKLENAYSDINYDIIPAEDDKTTTISHISSMQSKNILEVNNNEKEILLDLAFQVYCNDKNQIWLRSLSSENEPENYSPNTVSKLKTKVKTSYCKLVIPIDIENNLLIHINKENGLNKFPRPRVNKDNVNPIFVVETGTQTADQVRTSDNLGTNKSINSFANDAILSICEREIMPLQVSIKSLKKEIDSLAGLHMAVKKSLHDLKEPKLIRFADVGKPCQCYKRYL